MTLGSRGQLHVYVRADMCLYHQAIYIMHIAGSGRAYTLLVKYVTLKVHGSVFLILVL